MEDAIVAEPLEDRDKIGKCLVEGEHVGGRRKREARAQAIEKGVADFVGNDVVRQTGKEDAAGEIVADRLQFVCAIVPEGEDTAVLVIVSILAVEGMRANRQLERSAVVSGVGESPSDIATERRPER